MPDAIVKLRGHHLLCILSYRGEGYTPEFIKNFDSLVGKINKSAEIEIVSGVDSICGALHRDGKNACEHADVCREDRVRVRDNIALKDVSRVLKTPLLKAGDKLKLGVEEVTELRQYFANGEIRRACKKCSWHNLCSQIAAKKFSDVTLFPPRAATKP